MSNFNTVEVPLQDTYFAKAVAKMGWRVDAPNILSREITPSTCTEALREVHYMRLLHGLKRPAVTGVVYEDDENHRITLTLYGIDSGYDMYMSQQITRYENSASVNLSNWAHDMRAQFMIARLEDL